jgi:DNA invertase Pin-like site-specific DNA recombinase
MKRAALYLRRSTERQEQSIEDQRRALSDHALKHGLEVVSEYVDDAVSGALTVDRLAFLRMIEEAQGRPPPFREVLVYDVSRFGRIDNDEAGYYRHLLTKAGVEVVYVAEGLSGDESDDLLLPVKQFMASKYVKDLSKVTLRGQVSRVEKGRWCGGRPPYGYDLRYVSAAGEPLFTVRFLPSGEREIRRLDGALERVIPRREELPVASTDRAELALGDPGRAAVVRRIFGSYVAEDLGYSRIVDRLNAEGIPAPGPRRKNSRDGKWSAGTVREILLNPAYKGALCWNRRTFAKFNRVSGGRAVPRPKAQMSRQERNPASDWVVIERSHEAIVEPGLWARAQRVMPAAGARPSAGGAARAGSSSSRGSSAAAAAGGAGRATRSARGARGRASSGR